MDTSLRELARRSPHNRSAFSRFSLFMKRSAKSLPPATTSPLESNEFVNSAFLALDVFAVSMSSGLLGPKATPEAVNLTKALLPFITSWLTHFVDHIILPAREAQFEHDFAAISSTLIVYLVGSDARDSMAAIQLPSREGHPQFFICHVLSSLLLHTYNPLRRRGVTYHCFEAIEILLGSKEDAPWCRQLFDLLRAKHEAFVSLFISVIISELGSLQTMNTHNEMEVGLRVVSVAYRAMKFWASDTIVVHELMRRGYSRWTCQAIAKTTNTRSLRYICMFSAMERPTVGVAGACLGVLWNHLADIILNFGHVHAIEAYTSKAFIGTFRFADLVQNCVQGNAIRDRNLHIHILTKMLGAVTPYALYYSVFKLARRAQKTLEWKLPVDELLGDLPSWQEYKRTLDNMEGHRSHYKSNPQTLCANEECPNKFQTGFPMKRCTSCGVQIYCSSDCQRADWPRHRDAAKCALVSKEREANISNAWTLQDDHIYSILLKSGLRSLGHDQPKVMRYLDFTVVPPSISIAYPEGYERSDDWETGENEERCGPFYSKFPAGRVPRVEFGNQYFDPGLYDRARMSPENPPL